MGRFEGKVVIAKHLGIIVPPAFISFMPAGVFLNEVSPQGTAVFPHFAAFTALENEYSYSRNLRPLSDPCEPAAAPSRSSTLGSSPTRTRHIVADTGPRDSRT